MRDKLCSNIEFDDQLFVNSAQAENSIDKLQAICCHLISLGLGLACAVVMPPGRTRRLASTSRMVMLLLSLVEGGGFRELMAFIELVSTSYHRGEQQVRE